ncbi:aromatic ring-hydroxylating dioxygenase subunit alpha [Croceicoccus sediminis]|uniref:aromatic ring-hydroxylating dioxygenase subunit alpha n=1 Tax=Croceicoccus sediminis TaxID=2571150 RepID=UPI001183CBDE|nr:aromatic ring-hydroxylating dioxygenase subunit alpha [Croceicoccus sediminis]
MKVRDRFLKKAWYAAALSSEVNAADLFHRKILGKSVMIYRLGDGTAVALHDRCPHRFAPLSMGKRVGDEVACPYHALRFDGQGQCTHNPHGQGHIPKAAKVDTFPLVEKYGFLWIWMDESEADLSLLPDYSPLDEGPETGVGFTYMNLPVNYELIIDNVMDLSHIDHVHGEIITTRGKLSPLVPRVHETDRTVSARWEWSQQPAMMIFAPFLPKPEEEARQYFDITWSAPASIQLTVAATQEPEGFENDINQYDLHTCTPADELETHYFFATRRNHVEDDAEYNAQKIAGMHAAFEDEDGPLVMAVQAEMGDEDFFSLNPVLMSNDVAPVKVRKLLTRMIETENHSSGGLAEATE